MQIEEQGENGEADRGKVRRCRQTKGADADMQAADADIRTGGNAGKEKQNWKHVKWNSKLALIF
jgi:hypothetical protein